ncbi:uncharacterized protein LOC111710461, partial [Eurytemora carolleeae]|uniref:uncharacterized protein LOC111710461 n=1 Tax=Eurytemora carolleeae TaxID=1294199 RepID=UPI000C75C652
MENLSIETSSRVEEFVRGFVETSLEDLYDYPTPTREIVLLCLVIFSQHYVIGKLILEKIVDHIQQVSDCLNNSKMFEESAIQVFSHLEVLFQSVWPSFHKTVLPEPHILPKKK